MKKGFTLIELLVVITIILVLSGIGIISYTGAQRNARDNKRKADLEQLRAALEMYRSDEDLYPIGSGEAEGSLRNLTPDYIDEIPEDPRGFNYFYESEGESEGYTYSLYAYLEGGGDGENYGNNCGAPEPCNYQVRNP